ncbi:hypothetical protein CYFUS_008298 [Cystobacter fuscus]|uniref:Uncharacterized protein n=1 Tax=Cystobacter fuscus TaxID=43 RepID=A0A250JFZ7_9BACT|nr:hypothetical protein [Cystobacter fuscus]ATB42819.1 hypothetical protein CYFUS_008298 [Cystobacter fuscus]
MSIYHSLHSAFLFAASRRHAAEFEGRKEEQRLWIQVNAYRDFIMATGQVYLFEDYLKEVAPMTSPQVSTALEAHQDTISQRVMALLLKVFDETPVPEQKQSVSLLISQVNFIADTGQLEACEDYIKNRLGHAPLAIEHFTTREEAETWLRSLTEPPSSVLILIGDEYHQMWHDRKDNTRGMYREYMLEPYVEGLVAEGIPPNPPSFKTRAEAEAWLENHPTAPFEFVSIAGEHHLAVHHQRLKRHTLHHVASTLTQWEERKRAVEREEAQNAVVEAEGEDE